MRPEIQANNPAIIQFIKPFLVIVVFRIMEVEYIFADQDKFVDSVFEHRFHHIAVQVHNIVIKAVVPFAYKFDNTVTIVIISKKYF